jgi:phosphohistidine swiveling domain-containing protein
MTNPNLAKGAVPLDAASRSEPSSPAAQAKPEQANSAASPPRSEPGEGEQANKQDPVYQMGLMLSTIYNAVRMGHVKALMVVFVDDSSVPQVGFHIGSRMAVPMLGGMTIATDLIKDGAKKTMDSYREHLRKKAEFDAAKPGAPDKPGEGEQRSEPGKGEQAKH